MYHVYSAYSFEQAQTTSHIYYPRAHLYTVLHANISTTGTVNSLMFAGINVCVFETKPCSRGLIFVVSKVSLVGT